MATRHVLAEISSAASAAGLPAVEIESVGGVDAAKRVRAGESWDLVFLAQSALVLLADEGRVDAATLRPVVRSHVAVAVASGSSRRSVDPGRPSFSDAAAVRDAVAAADRIGYSTGPSGDALLDLLARWGLAGEVDERLVRARPGLPVAALLADGRVDLGFQQLSELVGQPGVEILGTLPADCAITTVFAGAVATTSTAPSLAREALAFYTSEASAPIKRTHSFEVPDEPFR
ncbi:molybdate ABC transporter substrate-binding protein [Microbacterium sp. MTN4-12]